MSETTKKSILIKTVATCWAGLILATLIMTYGTHGPAKHPKVFLVFPIVLGPLVAGALQTKVERKAVLWSQGLIFLGALIGSVFITENEALPPIATTVFFCLCAAISILTVTLFKREGSPQEESDQPETEQ